MRKKNAILFFALMICKLIWAQNNIIHSSNIASLQVVAGNDWLAPLPIISLGDNKAIHIDFDDLTHEYHRYTYTLTHCEADWSETQNLFTSDYAEGFTQGLTIDNAEESVNTNQLYTHYSLQIPNRNCNIKMGGNYKLTIFDENDGNTPVITACFLVVEPRASITMNVTTNTDIDVNKQHQQVELQLNYGSLNVTSPATQIKSVLLQNGNWHTARWNIQPQITLPHGLQWTHCRDYIFDAGNEYHKFETLDVTHTTMGISEINWDGEWFNAYLYPNEPRNNYLFDEDANGAFYIRNSDNDNNNTLCEYIKVHFTLKTPYCGRHIYINGKFTNGAFDERYEMNFNNETNCYEKTLILKQGYYSYQYLVEMSKDNYRPVDTEGNFYQTENAYTSLIYYKGIGERTERLIGVCNNQNKAPKPSVITSH